MAKKRKPKKSVKAKTPADILELWKTSLAQGLNGKKLDASITTTFSQPLLDQIQSMFDDGNVFGATEEKNTRHVAKDLGKICRMLSTKKNTISLDVFQAAFDLVQHFHDVCPAGGSGGWCEFS
jgi:hypothetical protein